MAAAEADGGAELRSAQFAAQEPNLESLQSAQGQAQ